MEQIFAPWRIEWIERDDAGDIDGCPFCVLPERDDDRESRIVARSEHSFVLLNNYPYNPGHAMVIPNRHTGDFGDLSDAELLDHAKLKRRTLDALDAALGPAGCNAGENLGGDAAGGSIGDHLHTHVVPRWDGDTNFMPVISDTKVIVEALEDTYDRLHEAFAEQAGATVSDETGAVVLDLDA
ncbi:Diadenosine tetraphosphate (Ap4A) hydrolase [Halogranum gelatinilyticum]|uniref:Diadenosine tetraphosphate (Ap4A) hydrolase n=1 Tax=Halogranum gelatinilyticum TaxID=660521 RepID=A0A1G9UD27_9EURY|nr:HIT domain-containing protein [Halogranum gelatinilyticum]SDM57820.1 Diadenosine tetraphosphate (Ap4A) hydrolase [Halogranum gelatinilyticum]